MSLKEAYHLAHTAECRLHIAASRPDRNLRFVVGHLMHYESLRLRIVEIEHDISKSQRASAVQFKGTGHVNKHHHQPSPLAAASRRSPPPPAGDPDDEDDDEEDEDDDDPWSGGSDPDNADTDLGLQRFPSGSSKPARQPPPELEPDAGPEVDDLAEPSSPPEPDAATLEALLQSQPVDPSMATMYEGVRRCPCHGHQDAPAVEKMWELPPSSPVDGAKEMAKEGVTRFVAQVAV